MLETWDLTHVYAYREDFDKDYEFAVKEILPAIRACEGNLSDKETLKTYLNWKRKADEVLSHLGLYASMQSDLDKRNIENSALYAKIDNLFNEFSEADSFSDPELLKLGKEKVDAFLKENPEYADFDFGFDKLFRSASHILPGEQEKLMSYFSSLEGKGSEMYSMLSVGDYRPKKVTLSDGKEVEVNLSNWTMLVGNAKTEEDRKAIFESLYSYYDEHKNTYGEIYNTVLQSELAEVKARGYSSILQEHLYSNKIPESVFHNLVEVASTENEPLHRYYEIRRKYLGLEKHRSYDRFIQLAHSDKKYTYEEARNLFYDSISWYPEDYQKKAHEVTKEGYVDVYPHTGKRTGAYSTGGENIHPFILLNFNGELDDCFTLAHESGHSVHTMYSEEAQPLLKQNYTIFVAEIASTFNEHNLLDYLMQKGDLSKEDRIFLLQKSIDEIVSTFYRQTLFAQYEYEISKLAEKGEPINHDVLSKKMIELYKIYYGIDISEEKVKPLVWAYIPHLFYTPFYVYQYATSFTASMLIYKKVKAHEPHAFDNYIAMLKTGGSMYPIEEVKLGGADLTKKEAFEAVTERMESLVNELEKLLQE